MENRSIDCHIHHEHPLCSCNSHISSTCYSTNPFGEMAFWGDGNLWSMGYTPHVSLIWHNWATARSYPGIGSPGLYCLQAIGENLTVNASLFWPLQ